MRTKLCVLAVMALVIWSMKRHYGDASADDLWWILTPTTRVVGAMTGTTFVAVPSEGHVSHERLFVIEKSCAGINFLAAAFGMLVVALLHRVGSGRSGLGVLGASLLTSYGAAISSTRPASASPCGLPIVRRAVGVHSGPDPSP